MKLNKGLATLAAAVFGVVGLVSTPASAVESPTVKVSAVCNTVNVTANSWPAGSTLKVWVKTRGRNYLSVVDTVFAGSISTSTPTSPATSFYTDKIYYVNVYGPNVPLVVLSGTMTRC